MKPPARHHDVTVGSSPPIRASPLIRAIPHPWWGNDPDQEPSLRAAPKPSH